MNIRFGIPASVLGSLILALVVLAPRSEAATANLIPNGAGSSTQWTASGASANWRCVTANDGDSSYVYTSTYNSKDSYAMGDLASASSISSVQLTVYARDTLTKNVPIRAGINSGGTDSLKDVADLTNSYVAYGGAAWTWTTDPATGLAWTLSGLNALQTVIIHNTDKAYEARVTQVYLTVNYTIPSPTPTATSTPTPTPAGYKTPTATPTTTVTPSPSITPTVTPTVTPTPAGYKTPSPTPSAPPTPSPAPPMLDGIVDDIYYDWGKRCDFEGFYKEAKAVLHVLDVPEIDPYYIWLAWEIDRDFNDNSFGTNIHFTWGGGHIWDDLIESDLQRLAISNKCGEVVVDATMDYVDGPPYHSAYPTASGFDVNMDSTESVKNSINGGNWSIHTFEYKTSIVYNQNNVYTSTTTSPAWADETNYVAAAPYQNWEYSLVWEMRVLRDLFVTPTCTEGGIWPDVTSPLELHASPSKAGVSPVVNFRWTGVIGDYVWLDADKDGIQDVGERGIPNVTLALYNDPDGDGDPDGAPIATAITNIKGKYLFDKLGHGTYLVVVTDDNDVLEGYVMTVGTTNPHGPIELERRERYLDADFGYWPIPATIGDFVWADTDADGRQDSGEQGIGGVTLDLLQDLDEDGNFTDWVATTCTSSAGFYLFKDLEGGDYVVDVTDIYGVLSGWNHTTGIHSRPDPTFPIHVDDGDIYLNADFGYHTTALGTIGNTVWYDDNQNGTWQSQTEEGILYVTTDLVRDDDGDGVWDTGERIINSTETTDYGSYYYTGIPLDQGAAGHAHYLVRVSDVKSNVDRYRRSIGPSPGADNNSQPDPYSVTLSAQTAANYTADWGYYYDQSLGMVGDQVWYDMNNDQIKQDPEQGVEGVTLRCWRKQGQTFSYLVGTTATDHSGLYFFPLLKLSYDYRVEVLAENFEPGAPLYGYTCTNQTDSTDESIVLSSGQKTDLTLDFGYYKDVPTWHLGDYVWEDTDADGNQDPGESGLEDVTLEVYEDTNGDGIIEAGEPLLGGAITDAGGWYSFTGLGDGDYLVKVTDENSILNGYYQTYDPDETGVCTVCDAEGWGSIDGAPNLEFDFGFVQEGQEESGRLGDLVWEDADKDGIQDAGESGVSGVLVNLYKDESTFVASTETDGSGFYAFSDLPAGVYYVEFADIPEGYYFTPQDRGDDDAKDSDADIATGKTASTILTAGEIDTTWDCGLYTTRSKCFDVQRFALASAQTDSVEPVNTGLEVTVNLSTPGALAALGSFNARAPDGATIGRWDLRLDDAWSSQTVERYVNNEGAPELVGAVNVFEGLSSGLHTVRLRHSTSDAAHPVQTENASLVLLPLVSADAATVLNHGLDTLGGAGDTTASSELTAVNGLSTSVTLDTTRYHSRVFVAAVVGAESAAGGDKEGTWDLQVDGVTVGNQVRRFLSGSNDLAPVILVGLSDLLNEGTYPVTVRHAASSGTLRSLDATLIAIGLGDKAGTEETSIASSRRTFSNQTGTSFTSFTDIAWSRNTMYVGDDDQILVAASFTTEHGSGALQCTARHDITVASDPVAVTAEGNQDLPGSDDLTSGGLFGLSDPLEAGTHTGYLRHSTDTAGQEVLTGDTTFVMLGICCEANPTAVWLVDFKADGYDCLVAVSWETVMEESLGFFLHRSESADGPYLKLNQQLISSLGSGQTGGRYLYVDRAVVNGRRYYYRLEEIGRDGQSTWYGPADAAPEASAGAFTYNPADYLVVVDSGTVSVTPTPPAVPVPTIPPPAPPVCTPSPVPSSSPAPLSSPSPLPMASATPTPSAAPPSPLPIIAYSDYDGDGASDIALFREASGTWFIRGVTRVSFGRFGDIPASGDYDGDGIADIAIFRPAAALWAVSGVTRVVFGIEGDLPAPADFDGDGVTDLAIFRPREGLWAVRGVTRPVFGRAGDWPIPFDQDGDGAAEIAVFRPDCGRWAVRGHTAFWFGTAGDIPIPRDYDGDGTGDRAVFRSSVGMWRGAFAGGEGQVYFGAPGDLPVPADYDGSEGHDVGIFRPDSGRWAIQQITSCYFGIRGDLPAVR